MSDKCRIYALSEFETGSRRLSGAATSEDEFNRGSRADFEAVVIFWSLLFAFVLANRPLQARKGAHVIHPLCSYNQVVFVALRVA